MYSYTACWLQKSTYYNRNAQDGDPKCSHPDGDAPKKGQEGVSQKKGFRMDKKGVQTWGLIARPKRDDMKGTKNGPDSVLKEGPEGGSKRKLKNQDPEEGPRRRVWKEDLRAESKRECYGKVQSNQKQGHEAGSSWEVLEAGCKMRVLKKIPYKYGKMAPTPKTELHSK